MKINGVNITRGHRRNIECFARRIGSGKIETDVIAHHESHDRQREILQRLHADAHHNGRGRLQNIERLTGSIQQRDT